MTDTEILAPIPEDIGDAAYNALHDAVLCFNPNGDRTGWDRAVETIARALLAERRRHTVEAQPEIDGGEFEKWSLSDISAECRSQSRDQLDPQFSRFMGEVAKRLAAPTPPRRAEVAPEWQPIETAPKDGTEIIGHDEKTRTSHVTSWNQYDWHDPDSHYYSEAPDFVPTHWMPLPAGPALGAGKKEGGGNGNAA